MLKLVGFDADDTLWHSEGFYREVHAQFETILGQYIDIGNANVHDHLLEVERANIKLFGYGAKGMTLSMLETAVAMTAERISAHHLHEIIQLGKEVLNHPVQLLDGIAEAVAEVSRDYPVVLITKGDLFHQESKVARSGLSALFGRIEIVSEKDPVTYQRVLSEFGLQPQQFLMVGNSLHSDIAPVLQIGGFAVHVPYPLTWALDHHEGFIADDEKMRTAESAARIPAAVRELAMKAARFH
ncbi:MAG: HAD family hydrolase [Arenimonas sp.]|jgi:putative hydrolase of the HAD superfamily|uniref:HAD family hydrolase n=1 Tax=Arenimonas sp. TaxID=1872635 RepID=UPI003C0FAEA7